MDTDGNLREALLWSRLRTNATLNPSGWKRFVTNRRRIEDRDRCFSLVYNKQQVASAYARLPNIKKIIPPKNTPAAPFDGIIIGAEYDEVSDGQNSEHQRSRCEQTTEISEGSSTSSLPDFPRRMPITSKVLLRRPTITKAPPLLRGSDLFDQLSASAEDFQMFALKGHIDTFKFYVYKYPLLMTMVSPESQADPFKRNRSKSIVSPLTFMLQHKVALDVRLADIEDKMAALEHDYKEEECKELETVLRDPVFNPTTYPWNVYNEHHFRRKDSQDAAIKLI